MKKILHSVCLFFGKENVMLDITKFGAVGDGKTVNTTAIQTALEEAAKLHTAILIPEGVFITGTLNLHGASIHLAHGAVLKGSPDLRDYPIQDYLHNEMGLLRALLINRDSDNVTIDGSGTIDFSGGAFYDKTARNVPESRVPFTPEQTAECTYPIGQRPNQCLFFHNSKHVTLREVRFIDAPCWTLSFHDCEDVKLLGLTIDTDLNMPNDDGIHICSCRGVIISDCNISSGDDCIALSGITSWEKACENIVITNCVLRSCSKTIVMGYVYSHVRNVTISNCVIYESNRGLTFMCDPEGGLIENVQVTNMVIHTRARAGNWWGNGEPIFMMAVPHHSGIPAEQNPHRETDCSIRKVRIDGVTCTGENAMGIVGVNGNIQEVSLRDIDYTRTPARNLPLKGSRFDFAPGEQRNDIPENCGLYIGGGAQVELRDVNTHEWQIITE